MSDVMLCGVLRMPPELWRDDPLQFTQVHSRMQQAADELEKRAAMLAEAAAFLDRQADRIAGFDERLDQATADCRAMAKKLRGET